MRSIDILLLLKLAITTAVVGQQINITNFTNSSDFFAEDSSIDCNPPFFPSVCQQCCCGARNFYCAVIGECCCSQANSACCDTNCCDAMTQNCCDAPTPDGNGIVQSCDEKPTTLASMTENLRIDNSILTQEGLGAGLNTIPPPMTGQVRTYAIPVGQGDCTILQCPNGNIVFVDCGSSGGARVSPQNIQSFLGQSIGNVVAILISHPDADHTNYLPSIGFQNNSVANIIIGGNINQYSQDIRNWFNTFPDGVVKMIQGGLGCINNCTLPMNFCSDTNIQFSVLAANVINMPDRANELSAVWKVSYNAWSLLLPGDMEGPASTIVTNALANSGLLQVTHYKMAHHGASTSANRQAWLNQIRPTEAFASNGYNFGNCRHPRCLTISRLLSLNTIQLAPAPHTLVCGTGTGISTLNNFCRRIYATTPTQNTICLIVINTDGTSASTTQMCQQVATTTGVLLEGAVDSDECFVGLEDDDDDGDDDDGASRNTVAILAMALCMLNAFIVM